MNKYDLKLSNSLSAIIEYEKTDYLTDYYKNIRYCFHYVKGELISVSLDYYKLGNNGEWECQWKYINPKKFNSEFWKKAPKVLNFDDCKWERKTIFFHPGSGYTSYNSKFHQEISCII